MRITCLLLALVVTVVSGRVALAGCSSTNTGVMGWWPKYFEDQYCGCTIEGLVDKLVNGVGRLGGVAECYTHENLEVSPEPLSTVANRAPFNRTFLFKTHGAQVGWTGVYYSNATDRNLAFTALTQAGWVAGTHIVKIDLPPAPGIYVYNAGTSSKIASQMDSERIIGAFHCLSYPGTMSAWGVSADGPGTFFGYNYSPTADSSCSIVQRIISRMGCYSYPLYGHQTDDAVRGFDGITLAGNRKNQYNCEMSCWDWAVNFLDAHADQASGEIRWAVRGEDVQTRYVIRGYLDPSGEPQSILEVAGQGQDGYGIVSAYSVQISGTGFSCFDVVEYDDTDRATVSDLFSWGSEPAEWPAILALNGVSLETLVQTEHEPAPLLEWKDGEPYPFNPSLPPEAPLAPPYDENCADVVVYSPVSGYLTPLRTHYRHYQTAEGYTFKVRTFTGSTDPLQARAVLQSVIASNVNYMETWWSEGMRSYSPRPILQIAGDTMGCVLFPDDPWESCLQPSCKSYNMIYDVTGDGNADGEINVVPCDTVEQLESLITATEQWNQSQFVDPAGTLQVLCGDRKDDDSSPELPVDMTYIEDVYRTSGNAVASMLRESQYGRFDFEEMREASYAAINGGRRDIWLQGLTTRVDDLTEFINERHWFDIARLTTKQRIMVFAPTCESGAIWLDLYERTFRKLLFNDPDKTVAAGFVGSLNAAYEDPSAYARIALLNELSNSEGQTWSMGYVVHRAVQALKTQFPDYGKGLTFFGVYALAPGDVSVLGAPLGPANGREIKLWSSNLSSYVSLHFTLAHGGRANLDIFDVRGRKVSSIVDDELAAGTYTYSWFSNRAAGGVYFARLVTRTSSGERSASHKIVLVR